MEAAIPGETRILSPSWRISCKSVLVEEKRPGFGSIFANSVEKPNKCYPVQNLRKMERFGNFIAIIARHYLVDKHVDYLQKLENGI